TTPTAASAAMRIAGPTFPESGPPPGPGVGGSGCAGTGLSSAAQFWQKTRSDGFSVPQLGQMIPVGGGGGGGGGGIGWGAGEGPVPPSGVVVGLFWVVSGAGSASFSPVHSRNEPQLPQNCAPLSFSNPQTLHVITVVSGQSTFAGCAV